MVTIISSSSRGAASGHFVASRTTIESDSFFTPDGLEEIVSVGAGEELVKTVAADSWAMAVGESCNYRNQNIVRRGNVAMRMTRRIA